MNFGRVYRAVKGLVVGQVWRIRGVRIVDRMICDGLAPEIGPRGVITLESRVSFRGRRRRSRLGTESGASLTIGERCFINSGVVIEASVGIAIGPNCLIGDEVQIQDSSYHEVDERGAVKRKPIRIGRNVWIGNRVTILPGVTVGDHSVIAAGSIVTKDVPPRRLVAGTPARVIREIACSDTYVRR